MPASSLSRVLASSLGWLSIVYSSAQQIHNGGLASILPSVARLVSLVVLRKEMSETPEWV